MEPTTPPNEEPGDVPDAAPPPAAGPPRRLHRARQGRMLAGVCAGAAEYLDVDVTVVRVALVALAFVGGAGIPLYAAAWLLVPEEGTDEPIASELVHRVAHL